MKFNEFVNTYYGKAIDYDGGYGVQCVDLIKLYADKVFNLKFGAFGNAHTYYDNYTKIPMLYENFTRIANTPDFVPQKGDIVVWNTKRSNGNGHIAIATGEGNTKYFWSYDMNWDGKGGEMKKIIHDYTNVSGVLRPRNQSYFQENNFNVGEIVVVTMNVKDTNARQGDFMLVDNSEKQDNQFWIHKSVVQNGILKANATICYVEGSRCIVQVFDDENAKQFWANEKYLKKL